MCSAYAPLLEQAEVERAAAKLERDEIIKRGRL